MELVQILVAVASAVFGAVVAIVAFLTFIRAGRQAADQAIWRAIDNLRDTMIRRDEVMPHIQRLERMLGDLVKSTGDGLRGLNERIDRFFAKGAAE